MILAGIFDPIINTIGAVLAFFYGIVPNLGLDIIFLTLCVMLATFPLTAKQAKSMMEMQRHQPEIKKLQAKYKGDRQKLNEETMKYYQEHKINPLSGCLPLLIQTPILIGMFQLLRNPYEHVPVDSQLFEAFCHPVKTAAACGKAPLPHQIDFLGIDLLQHATGVTGGFVDALPYFLLVGISILTGFIQARQSRRNSPNMTSQMAMITTVLPVGLGLLALTFPAGLVIYLIVSNTWRIGQQELILRRITGPAAAAAGGSKAIDVKSQPGEPKPSTAPGGLRKLFQLPTANGDAGASPTGNGDGSDSGERSGGSAPAKDPGAAKNPKPGATGRPAGSSQPPSRRTNKKRRRR